MPHTSGFVNATVFNSKISKVENKIPGTSSLVTYAVLHTSSLNQSF